MLGAKISPQLMERLEKFADEKGISKSQATERMIEQGLNVQENDVRVVPVRSDGGTVIEDGFEQIDNQLQEVNRDLKDQTEHLNDEIQTVKEQELRYKENTTGVFVGLTGWIVWTAGVVTYNVPTWLSLGTATFLILFILYFVVGLYLGDYNE